jgi:hypothetical protein
MIDLDVGRQFHKGLGGAQLRAQAEKAEHPELPMLDEIVFHNAWPTIDGPR